MRDYLIACRLEPEPAGKLPAWGGLLDVADEHGLWSFRAGPEGLRPLPEGMLLGGFADEAAALAALDAALESASDLLGYPVRARGRVACPAGPGGLAARQIPFAEAQALLYLSLR